MVVHKIKRHSRILKREIRKHTVTAISAAFGFIIALTWRDTIKTIVNSFVVRFNIAETAYLHELVVAIIITAICVLGIIAASGYALPEKEENKD